MKKHNCIVIINGTRRIAVSTYFYEGWYKIPYCKSRTLELNLFLLHPQTFPINIVIISSPAKRA